MRKNEHLYMYTKCIFSVFMGFFYRDLLSAWCTYLYFAWFAIKFIVFAYNESLNFTDAAQNFMSIEVYVELNSV